MNMTFEPNQISAEQEETVQSGLENTDVGFAEAVLATLAFCL